MTNERKILEYCNGGSIGRLDLSNADLLETSINFLGAVLKGANLSGSDLTGIQLRCADLRNADLRDTSPG